MSKVKTADPNASCTFRFNNGIYPPSDSEASNQDDDAERVQNADGVPDLLEGYLESMPILCGVAIASRVDVEYTTGMTFAYAYSQAPNVQVDQ
jgi:hypothetical protein